MHSKYLKNRLNKDQAIQKLANESFERRTLSFYKYVKIKNPKAMRDELFRVWYALDCLGRIYIAEEGINAQMNVPVHNWDKFVETLYSFPEFEKIPFKHAVEAPEDSFWKLSVKTKDKIVADGLDDSTFDASDVGTHLDAEKFNQMLEDPESICVDMRNFYESEVGKFDGAICPEASTFREELPMVKEELAGKEDKPVLLYCTGGIRCEKASAYLKHHGFNRVHQLHGGIIQYAHEIEEKGLESKFKGKNYVFDERNGERITDDILTNCHQCGALCDDHTNCKNKACNLLFIQCEKCMLKNEGTCSANCQSILHLPEAEQRAAWKKFEKPDDMMLGRNPYHRKVHHKSMGKLL